MYQAVLMIGCRIDRQLCSPCPSQNRTCPIKAYGSSNSLWGPDVTDWYLIPAVSVPIVCSLLCCFLFPSSGMTVCCRLRSICFHRLHHYYAAVRLLAGLQGFLCFLGIVTPYRPADGNSQISQVCMQYLVCSPRSKIPVETTHSGLANAYYCLLWRQIHRLPLLYNEAELLHACALRLSHSTVYA